MYTDYALQLMYDLKVFRYIFRSTLVALRCPAVSDCTEVKPTMKNQFYSSPLEAVCFKKAKSYLSTEKSLRIGITFSKTVKQHATYIYGMYT